MKKIVITILSLISYVIGSSQSSSVQEYINAYKDLAISEMKRVGIPASITIAQGILETESGNSNLVKRSNNHFGIKCKHTWTGPSVSHDDDAVGECFRKYETAEDSYRDHSNFLRGSNRYAFLFDLDPLDYKGWAHGLKKAGYATNPKYPAILIRNIETYNLQQYDQPGAETQPIINDVALEPVSKKNTDAVAKHEVITKVNLGSNTASIKAGKTLFNGLKAVLVPAGTSLLAIATEFDISLSKLMEFNDLQNDGILQDEQWIFLEKKMKAGNRDYYISEQGETLHSISQTNAIQLEYLVQYNRISEKEILRKGTRVRLRPGSESGGSNKQVKNIIHEVQPKEGLYAISKKYDVSVQEIKEINSLSSDELSVGQQLIINK